MNKDPKRLLDDAGAPKSVREDLSLAASSPVAYSADAGLAKLQAAIGGSATTAVGAGGTSIGLKLIGLTIVGVLGVVGVVVATTSPGRQAAAPAPALTSPPPTTPPTTPPTPPPAPTEVTSTPAPVVPPSVHVPSPTTPHKPSAAKTDKPGRPARTPPEPMVDPDEHLRRETAQLADSRRLLTTNPAAALALVDAGQREFVGGMFVEERAAIAIFALSQLGRSEEVRERAEVFLRRYPAGSFTHRVRDLITAEKGPPR